MTRQREKYKAQDLVQPPSASALSESLRSLGYSFETALADLVDNSVTANATEVTISLAATEGSPGGRVAILDNGDGMSAESLLTAMKPGSRDPAEKRDRRDLGRFGLGLKTASFSQCRQLTVATRDASGDMSCLRWDLDHVRKREQWRLLEGPGDEVAEDMALLDTLEGSGTLVIWGRCDRIPQPKRFPATIERLRGHLGLVYHRLLATDPEYFGRDLGDYGEVRPNRIKIFTSLNSEHAVRDAVRPWNPIPEHPSCRQVARFPTDLRAQTCRIRGFVLPHEDRLHSDDEFNYWGGPDSWTQGQGIYLYRNNRILLAGGWLGLARGWRRDPETRLARVIVDFDNLADSEWAIDVKKSRASVPEHLRDPLIAACANARDESVQVFTHRRKRTRSGRISLSTPDGPAPVWDQRADVEGNVSFVVNREHPALQAAKKQFPRLESVLRLIERELPTVQIWHSEREHIQNGVPKQRDTAADQKALLEEAKMMVEMLAVSCGSKTEAFNILKCQKPYIEFPDVIQALEQTLKG